MNDVYDAACERSWEDCDLRLFATFLLRAIMLLIYIIYYRILSVDPWETINLMLLYGFMGIKRLVNVILAPLN